MPHSGAKAARTGLFFLVLALSTALRVLPQSFTDLGAHLRLDKTRFLVGEPIWAEVSITNPDTVLLYACMTPELSSVSGVQVYSGDGKEIRARWRDPRVTTPVVLTLPPKKRGFLRRLELSACFGEDGKGAFSPGSYRVQATFTAIPNPSTPKGQQIQDIAAFEVVAPEGKDRALWGKMRRLRGTGPKSRARWERLYRKDPRGPYALRLVLGSFAGATTKQGGEKVLQQGIERCERLIQDAPDQVASGVLVDSVAALSWRQGGKALAMEKLKGIAGSYPKTTAYEAAQEALDRLELVP